MENRGVQRRLGAGELASNYPQPSFCDRRGISKVRPDGSPFHSPNEFERAGSRLGIIYGKLHVSGYAFVSRGHKPAQRNQGRSVTPTVFVHLSDIHFTARDDGLAERRRSVRLDLMNDLASMHTEIGDATAVLVTGDIAFSGAEPEYEEAREWLDQVAAVVGADRAGILTVPGNHDVDMTRVGHSCKLAHQHLRDCPDDDLDWELERLLQDPGRPLLGPLDNYNKFAKAYDCHVPADGKAWEVPMTLPCGYQLAIRGLSSVFNSDLADGTQTLLLGKTQTTLPAHPGVVYFLLAHHGPNDCRDEVSIRDRIRDRAAVLLTGHRHSQRIRQVDQCIELTAGAVHPEEQTGWNPSYNWIRIDVEETGSEAHLSVEVWHREWRSDWNRFGSGMDAALSKKHRVVLRNPPLPVAMRKNQPDANGSRPTLDKDLDSNECQPAVPTTPSPTGAHIDSAQLETTAESRAAIAENSDSQLDERRVLRDFFDLKPPAQFRALEASGLLEPDDWTKDYLTMIGDALAKARDGNLLLLLANEIRTSTAPLGKCDE